MRQTLARRFLISNIIRSTETKIVNATGEKFLRKIDLAKDQLSPEQKMYIQKLVEKNNERFTQQKQLKRHYKITGFILFSFVFSIYFYTLFSIKQEKFLDDFDIPEPPDPAVKTFKKE